MNQRPIITGKDHCGRLRVLRHDHTFEYVREGDTLPDFRGDKHVITDGRAPHKVQSVGHVTTAEGAEYYSTVFNLHWAFTVQGWAEQ